MDVLYLIRSYHALITLPTGGQVCLHGFIAFLIRSDCGSIHLVSFLNRLLFYTAALFTLHCLCIYIDSEQGCERAEGLQRTWLC